MNESSAQKNPISLIILVHQEAQTIESVVREFHDKVISKIPNSEFIICEDGSTDGTKEILKKLQTELNLVLDLRDGKRGYTNAMRDGFRQAKNPIIFFSDSDGQHDPDDFWKMYPLMEKFDMVIGWKTDRKDDWYRLFITYVFNKLISLYFKVKLHDIDCGFRVMKKEVTDFLLTQDWKLKHCTNSELTVKIYYAGFRITEIPVAHFTRRFGESRGLPLKKLPSIIMHILKKFPEIKRETKILQHSK